MLSFTKWYLAEMKARCRNSLHKGSRYFVIKALVFMLAVLVLIKTKVLCDHILVVTYRMHI